MKTARVLVNGVYAGILEKLTNDRYRFVYENDYQII